MQTLRPKWEEYKLVDSGNAKKLERFGEFTLIRPEPQAKWPATLPAKRWDAADGEFVRTRSGQQGEWKLPKPIPQRWNLQPKNLKYWVQPAANGHVGVCPDQACRWD